MSILNGWTLCYIISVLQHYKMLLKDEETL